MFIAIEKEKIKTFGYCKKYKRPVSLNGNCKNCEFKNRWEEDVGVDCDYIGDA